MMMEIQYKSNGRRTDKRPNLPGQCGSLRPRRVLIHFCKIKQKLQNLDTAAPHCDGKQAPILPANMI